MSFFTLSGNLRQNTKWSEYWSNQRILYDNEILYCEKGFIGTVLVYQDNQRLVCGIIKKSPPEQIKSVIMKNILLILLVVIAIVMRTPIY